MEDSEMLFNLLSIYDTLMVKPHIFCTDLRERVESGINISFEREDPKECIILALHRLLAYGQEYVGLMCLS